MVRFHTESCMCRRSCIPSMIIDPGMEWINQTMMRSPPSRTPCAGGRRQGHGASCPSAPGPSRAAAPGCTARYPPGCSTPSSRATRPSGTLEEEPEVLREVGRELRQLAAGPGEMCPVPLSPVGLGELEEAPGDLGHVGGAGVRHRAVVHVAFVEQTDPTDRSRSAGSGGSVGSDGSRHGKLTRVPDGTDGEDGKWSADECASCSHGSVGSVGYAGSSPAVHDLALRLPATALFAHGKLAGRREVDAARGVVLGEIVRGVHEVPELVAFPGLRHAVTRGDDELQGGDDAARRRLGVAELVHELAVPTRVMHARVLRVVVLLHPGPRLEHAGPRTDVAVVQSVPVQAVHEEDGFTLGNLAARSHIFSAKPPSLKQLF
eukprot:gene10272-biopygen12355